MIGVCGSGSWGTALAAVLATNTTDKVLLWGREADILQEISAKHLNNRYLPGIILPANIGSCKDIKTLLECVNDILIVVPSKAFIDVLRTLKPHLQAHHRIIWATKGLEPQRGRFLHEVVEEELGPQQIYAILSGPSFAAEVAKRLPTAVTIATKNEKFGLDLLKYFHSETFRVYLSNDIIGVQVGGVMKNILAVASGLSDGLGYGANARAALITRGIVEMMRFGVALGAKPETLHGLAGVGDVILSGTDSQSRNRRFGFALAKGLSVAAAEAEIGTVEAIHNVAEITRLAGEHDVEMPIAELVHKIFINEVTPQQAVQSLITREPSYEW